MIAKQLNYEKSNHDGLDAGSWHGPPGKRTNNELNDWLRFNGYHDGFGFDRLDNDGHHRYDGHWLNGYRVDGYYEQWNEHRDFNGNIPDAATNYKQWYNGHRYYNGFGYVSVATPDRYDGHDN